MQLLTIQVFIISWKEQHDHALSIANALEKEIDPKKITVVYSDPAPHFTLDTSCNSIQRPNELFWEDKFKTCLDHCQSDLMLVIHSDCKSSDWSSLAKSCQITMSQDPYIGVWAPFVQGTPWHISDTAITDLKETSLTMVAETDGIVFCLSKPVQKRMKQLNYNNNIYGWGIEHFFNACAAAQGLYSVVDKLQLVQHPPERGYPGQNAAETRKIFLSQMSSDEKRQHQLLMSIIKKKKRKKKYIKQINHLKRFMTQFYQTWRKKYGTL